MKIQDLLSTPVDDEVKQEYLKSPTNSSSYFEHIYESEADLHSQDHVHSSGTKDDNRVQKPNLTNSERQKIYDLLNRSSFNGKLPRGILSEVSLRFKVKPRTISRIWHQGQESVASGKEADVCSRIKLKSGRKKNKVVEPRLMRRKPKFKTRRSVWIS
jgi:hypothetical protein